MCTVLQTACSFHSCSCFMSCSSVNSAMSQCQAHTHTYTQNPGKEPASYWSTKVIRKKCDIVGEKKNGGKNRWVSVLKWHYCYLRVHMVHWCSQLLGLVRQANKKVLIVIKWPNRKKRIPFSLDHASNRVPLMIRRALKTVVRTNVPGDGMREAIAIYRKWSIVGIKLSV